jgi:hypothetical protein
VLRERIYSVRQAALLPAAPIFDAFTAILDTVYLHRVEGSGPLASLDDVAYFARQRMHDLS